MGSLWNANITAKLRKAKQQWSELRGDGASAAGKAMQPAGADSLVAEVESDAEFQSLVAQGRPMIVYFTASWCGPCRQIAPVFDSLATSHAAASAISAAGGG